MFPEISPMANPNDVTISTFTGNLHQMMEVIMVQVTHTCDSMT
jgi:hypothetical protein